MLRCASLLFALLLGTTTVLAAQSQDGSHGKIGAQVSAAVGAGQAARVVVMLESSAPARETPRQRSARIGADAEGVLARLPSGSFRVNHRYANVDALALDVSAPAVTALAADPAVRRVDLDVGGGSNMLEAAQASHIDEMRTSGLTGKGVAVAIVDSGAQLDHPDLADSIADEYCSCSSTTAGVGCCPDGSDKQTGSGSALDANGHGTNVSGIVSGNGQYAPRGGAPDATLVLARVLDANGRFSGTSDIVAALDWIASNHPEVKVVNLSVGTDMLFSTSCDDATAWTMALKQAVDAVGANGALVTAASGNNGSATSIAAPACISGVIAVGATWDSTLPDQTFLGCTDTGIVANKPTCFTNSNALVAIYAPGAYTTATGSNVDVATSNYAVTYAGTSQAAPLVAACIADIYQLHPDLSAAQVRQMVLASGAQVTDPKSGLSFPLLDCMASTTLVDQVFDAGFEKGT